MPIFSLSLTHVYPAFHFPCFVQLELAFVFVWQSSDTILVICVSFVSSSAGIWQKTSEYHTFFDWKTVNTRPRILFSVINLWTVLCAFSIFCLNCFWFWPTPAAGYCLFFFLEKFRSNVEIVSLISFLIEKVEWFLRICKR